MVVGGIIGVWEVRGLRCVAIEMSGDIWGGESYGLLQTALYARETTRGMRGCDETTSWYQSPLYIYSRSSDLKKMYNSLYLKKRTISCVLSLVGSTSLLFQSNLHSRQW
jgi:hypothetical protein